LHINCRSLRKNFDSIHHLLTICHPLTALALSETWLTAEIQDDYVIPGYNFVSAIREGKGGGGVGFYLNDVLEYRVRADLGRMNVCIECIFVEVLQPAKAGILLGCIYRPPNTDVAIFNSELLSILNIVDGEKLKLTLISGDFNLDLLKNGVHAPTGMFLNNMFSHSLFPAIQNPTRISEDSATLLDNIFIRCFKNNVHSTIIYSDISDHLPVAVRVEYTMSSKNKLPTEIYKRSFNPQAIVDFNAALSNVSWCEVYDLLVFEADPSHAYNVFTDVYKTLFDKFFPLKIIKYSHKMTIRKEWMTKGLLKSCHKKSKLYKKYRKHSKEDDKKRYITYRNKLKTLLRKREKMYYSEKFEMATGNMRKTWKLIGSVLNSNSSRSTPESFTVDGNKITNCNEIVERFNNYFVNIGSRLASSISNAPSSFLTYLNAPNPSSFYFYETSAEEIVNIISNFQSKQSTGIDEIPMSIVKTSAAYIAEPISRIINNSFTSGIVPDTLKIAKVCPIFKSGDREEFTNYRPISILPTFSKIVEKAVFNRLTTYLESKCMLIKNQYGFRQGHSTYMAIMDMYDKISAAMNRNEYSVGVFIDLSKAFDTLDHDILLKKLENYGLRGVPNKWFQNYLHNRKQYVFLSNCSSSMKSINYGVPQGSILGPLLFILYINDIVNCSSVLKFVLFADDTNLFHSDMNVWDLMSTLNCELMKLSNWFKANKLSLNISKTNYIIFGRKKIAQSATPLQLCIDGKILERVESTKFLGVMIDGKLNWSKHINHVSLKISKSLGIIGRLRNALPLHVLLTLYYTLIFPYLSYCNIIWGYASATLLRQLIVLQKRAVRIITSSPYRSESSPLFRRLHLLKLTDICKLQTALFMYKVKCKLLPVSCMQYCKINQRSMYSTRQKNYFDVDVFKTNIRERSIAVSGPRLWNSLTQEAQSCTSLSFFKRLIVNSIFIAY
jgi:hypothetical protein